MTNKNDYPGFDKQREKYVKHIREIKIRNAWNFFIRCGTLILIIWIIGKMSGWW